MLGKILEQTLTFICGKELLMYGHEYYHGERFFWCNQCQVAGIREELELIYHNASAEHEQTRLVVEGYNERKYNIKSYKECNYNLVTKSNIIFNEKDDVRLFWLEDEFDIHPGMVADAADYLNLGRLPKLKLANIKKMPKLRCQDKELDRERDNLSMNYDITNIVKSYSFHEDAEEGGYFYFAYEPSIITLMHLIHPNEHSRRLAEQLLPLVDIKMILINATTGLMNLHQKGFFHRNIRPENILIIKQDNDFVGKLSNMMLSKRLRQGCWQQSVTGGTFYGKDYTAPELKVLYTKGDVGAKVKVDSSIDVFSLGCCFFFALTGCHLFNDNYSDYSYLEEISEKWKIPIAKNIIEMMVHNNPSERPTSKQILEHPFFWNIAKVLRFYENANDFLQGNKLSVLFQQFSRDEPFFSGDWKKQVHKEISEKRSDFNGLLAADLIRTIRNRHIHYHDVKDEELRRIQGNYPDEFLNYYVERFPNLLLFTWQALKSASSDKRLKDFYFDD